MLSLVRESRKLGRSQISHNTLSPSNIRTSFHSLISQHRLSLENIPLALLLYYRPCLHSKCWHLVLTYSYTGGAAWCSKVLVYTDSDARLKKALACADCAMSGIWTTYADSAERLQYKPWRFCETATIFNLILYISFQPVFHQFQKPNQTE